MVGAPRGGEGHLGAAGAHGDAQGGGDGAVRRRAGVAHHQALALQHDGLRVILSPHRAAGGQQQQQQGQRRPQAGAAGGRLAQRPPAPGHGQRRPAGAPAGRRHPGCGGRRAGARRGREGARERAGPGVASSGLGPLR